MAGVNKVIILGNLGRDPELRRMQNGDAVVNFSVATSESWNDKMTNERREITEWHNIVFYRKAAETIAQYLRKGSQVYVEGKLRTRKWQDQNGQDRYTTEIIGDNFTFVGGRNSGSYDQAPSYGTPMGGGYEQPANNYAATAPVASTNSWDAPPPAMSSPAPRTEMPKTAPTAPSLDDDDIPF